MKKPQSSKRLGFCAEPVWTPWNVRVGGYMCSIITSPKPEHDTCVAPSINLAKS
jgi:hypothetical protein